MGGFSGVLGGFGRERRRGEGVGAESFDIHQVRQG